MVFTNRPNLVDSGHEEALRRCDLFSERNFGFLIILDLN
jgi:hypothetical protein